MQPGIGRSTKAGLVCLAALLATPAFAASDTDLQRRIEARLAKAGLEKRADIEVSVESGVARLDGHHAALRRPARGRAARPQGRARASSTCCGSFPRSPRSDKAIRERRREARCCGGSATGPSTRCGIDVEEGVVRLCRLGRRLPSSETRSKSSLAQRRRPPRRAQRPAGAGLLPGGRAPAPRDPREASTPIPLFERWADLPDPPVRVFVERGRVTLAGTVGSDGRAGGGRHARPRHARLRVNNQVKVEGEDTREEERKKDDDRG